jgi:predicted DNA-binding transcriptional regulator YafY
MKKQDKRLRRALFLVPYVTKFGDKGARLGELAETVGVAPAVLEKELRALLYVTAPDTTDSVNIFVDGSGPDARVSALPCRLLQRPPRLATQEALALLIGAEAVKNTGIAPYDAAIARAIAKLRKTFGSTVDTAGGSAGVLLVPPGPERRQTMTALSRACREKRTVELDYSSLAGQRRKKIVIEPYGLLNHTGSWYVLGKSLTHKENRIFVFKVERILGVAVLDTTFTVPKDFDVHNYVGQSLFMTDWKPVTVTLRLSPDTAERIGDDFPKQERERDGSLRVTFKDHITGWLAAWVLRQGQGVTEIEPVSLRNWVGELAKRVAEAHG